MRETKQSQRVHTGTDGAVRCFFSLPYSVARVVCARRTEQHEWGGGEDPGSGWSERTGLEKNSRGRDRLPEKMLQSTSLQPLLLQLLEPCPELTESLPLSASLISLDSQKPLLSCISKTAVEQDKRAQEPVNSTEGSETTFVQGPGNNTTLLADTNETMPLLQSQYNSTFGSTAHSSGNTTTTMSNNTGFITGNGTGNTNNSGDGSGGSGSAEGDNKLSPQYRIEELQAQLDKMDESYDPDYINANVNPVDNLNILSLMVIRDWSQRAEGTQWQAYSFGSYRLYIHEVSDRYALLLCTSTKYPSALAVARLDSLGSILSDKL